MNANNLSLYLNAQALMIEVEGMKAANLIAKINNEAIPYDESDFHRIGDSINTLASYTTNE